MASLLRLPALRASFGTRSRLFALLALQFQVLPIHTEEQQLLAHLAHPVTPSLLPRLAAALLPRRALPIQSSPSLQI
jgi:hypothetical protein